MEKRAAITKKGSNLKLLIIKVAAENGYNIGAARHNTLAAAAEKEPISYKSAAFRELIREIDSLIGLALTDE